MNLPKLIRILVCLGAMLTAIGSSIGFAFDKSHAAWTKVLQKNLLIKDGGRETLLNYKALKNDRAELDSYLSALKQVKRTEFDLYSKPDQMAFLVNAYNAFMVDLILQNYPITSVKKIGIPLVGPWKRAFVPLFGTLMSPDDLEHGTLRKNYKEPRIHFAINCVSASCPALRHEAFEGAKLEKQLEEQTRLFLTFKRENNWSADTAELKLNPIFKWFTEDFVTADASGDQALIRFAARYLPAVDEQYKIDKSKIKVRFSDYNWDLNDSKGNTK